MVVPSWQFCKEILVIDLLLSFLSALVSCVLPSMVGRTVQWCCISCTQYSKGGSNLSCYDTYIPHSHHVYVVCRQGDSKLKALYVMNDDSFPEVEEFVGQSTTRFVEQDIFHTVVADNFLIDSRHQVMYVGCTSYRNLQTTSSQCISCSNKTFAGVQKLMGIYNGFTKYSATCTRSFLCLLTEVLPYFFSQIWIGSHSYLWDHPGGPVSVEEKPSWSKGHLHGHQTHRPLFKFVVLVIHNYNSTCHI